MILQALGLTKYFPVTGGFTVNKWIKALDGVSVQVAEAETLGIVGESGSGKTTLARLFLLLERPTSGSLLFDGKATRDFGRDDLMRYRRSVQAVFQDPFSSLNPRMRVEDIVAEPLPRENGLGGAATRGRVGDVLQMVGLPRESTSSAAASGNASPSPAPSSRRRSSSSWTSRCRPWMFPSGPRS